jgi:hypothetical protein
MKTLTAEILKKAGAWCGQFFLFKELFPKGAEITEELCVKHAYDFDWAWAAENLLSAPARAEYDRVTAPARAECDRVTAPAWARSYLGDTL